MARAGIFIVQSVATALNPLTPDTATTEMIYLGIIFELLLINSAMTLIASLLFRSRLTGVNGLPAVNGKSR